MVKSWQMIKHHTTRISHTFHRQASAVPSACYTKEDATGAAKGGAVRIQQQATNKISRDLTSVEQPSKKNTEIQQQTRKRWTKKSAIVSPRFSIFATHLKSEATVPKAAQLPSAVFTCGTSKRRSELLPREEVPRETSFPWGNHGAMGRMAGSYGMAGFSQWENGGFLCLAGKVHGSVGHFGHFGHFPIFQCLTGKNHGFNAMMANWWWS